MNDAREPTRPATPPPSVPYYGAHAYYGGRPTDDGEGGFSPRRLLGIVKRKLPWILLLVALAMAVGWVILLRTPATYRASALIEVSTRRPRIAGRQGALLEDNYYVPSAELLNTRIEKFNGSAMRNEARAVLDEWPGGGLPWTAEELDRRLPRASFSVVRDSRLVRIACESRDPKLAAVAADAYAEAARRVSFAENKADSDNAVSWLEAQADLQRRNLEDIERAILEFRATNRLDALESEQATLYKLVAALGERLVEIEREEVLARDMARALDALSEDPRVAAGLPASAPRIEEIKAAVNEWTGSLAERESLALRYTEKHPEMRALDRRVEAHRARVMDAIAGARNTAAANRTLWNDQIASLRARIDESNEQAGAIEQRVVALKSTLASIEREREAAAASYQGLLNRIEEARLSADENTAIVKLIADARTPTVPVSPNRRRTLAIAAFLGLCCGLAWAIFLESLEDRVHTSEDIERDLHIKIIGLVPSTPVPNRRGMALYTIENPSSMVAEALASLRGILDSGQYRATTRTILVASSAPEEGKTTVAGNLAIALAKSGQRTLLIDFDLRRPRMAGIFGMPDSAESLLHALHEQHAEAFDRLVFEGPIPNFFVVGSRPSESLSPSDVVGGPFVKQFFDWAAERFDRVVIDSPPYGIVSDAVVLAGLVQSVLLICRPGRSHKRAMRHAIRHFHEVGANLAGVVVNDVNFAKGSYFSNFDHYYKHSYGRAYYTRDGRASRPAEKERTS